MSNSSLVPDSVPIEPLNRDLSAHEMLYGGIWRGSTTMITGAPGTAKTTMGGAFAEAAAKRGERTLYVAFDQSLTDHSG